MRRRPLLFAVLMTVAATVTGAETYRDLVAFQLEDASGATRSATDFAGRPLLVVTADGNTSHLTGDWTAGLMQAFGEAGVADAVTVVGLADLRTVPSFMRKRVRRSLATEAGGPLLDWKGVFAKAYDLERRHCNLLLFSADGRLLEQAAGLEVDAAVTARFARALAASVAAAPGAAGGS